MLGSVKPRSEDISLTNKDDPTKNHKP